MPEAAAHFVADGGESSFDPALDTLVPRFAVQRAAARRVVRTWLDTDDWLLHRAGMELEHHESDESVAAAGAGAVLTLRVAGGRDHGQDVPDVSWPAMIDAIPRGNLRSRIETVVGIRGLLPTAILRSRRRDLRLLNEDRKTVARLTIESPVSAEGTPLPPHLSVSAVRGYQDEADRVAAGLATVRGIAADSRSMYELALQAAGRAFGDDEPPAVVLTPSMPAAEAIVEVLQGFRFTVQRTLPGVIADIDTEFLHDFRVAVRRARSTLKLTGDVLQREAAEQLGDDLKWVADLTSATRDFDVYLLGLPDMAGGLQSADPAHLDPFRDHLRSRRRAEFARLRRSLRSARFARAMDHWRSLGLVAVSHDPGRMMSAGALAADRLARAHRRVTKRGRAIGSQSPAEDLHDLRKRCKELRYLLEIFRSLHDEPAHRAALKTLKGLQEVLGEFQDSEVQGLAVREFADNMLSAGSAPAPTVLAMGELAAQLAGHQHHARHEFAASFAAFASARNRRRFGQLSNVGSR